MNSQIATGPNGPFCQTENYFHEYPKDTYSMPLNFNRKKRKRKILIEKERKWGKALPNLVIEPN